MYEMADYLNVPDLVELCREAFLASIEPNNVLFELADSFSRLRKPIADALKDYAIKNWVGAGLDLQGRCLLTASVCIRRLSPLRRISRRICRLQWITKRAGSSSSTSSSERKFEVERREVKTEKIGNQHTVVEQGKC